MAKKDVDTGCDKQQDADPAIHSKKCRVYTTQIRGPYKSVLVRQETGGYPEPRKADDTQPFPPEEASQQYDHAEVEKS